MIPLPLAELATVVDGRIHVAADRHAADRHAADRTVVDAVGTDSRALPPGRCLFVALPGEIVDGHRFVPAAVEAGAVAVLAERPIHHLDVPVVVVDSTWRALTALAAHVRRRVAPTAVAITGSVGKTTVKDLTAAAVGAGRRVHAARGSFNNELGVPLTLLGLRADTEVLVAEIGARHVGDIAAMASAVAPDVSVVTAVAAAHLEIFGTIDNIARAKGELVEALSAGGTAVLNADDHRVAAMAARAPGPVLRVGLDTAGVDLTAEDIRLDAHARARAVALTPWGRVPLRLPVAGRHQVGNALFALAVAGHLGVDLEAAADGIARAPVSPWRGDVRRVAGVTVLNDAYNANPLAVRAAIDTLRALEATGRRIAVLGLMAELGDSAAADHDEVGRRCATDGVDHLVVVGHAAAMIAVGARAVGGGIEVVEVPDADAAIAHLEHLVLPGDAVLVKASRVAGLERIAAALVAARGDEGEAAS